MAETLNENSLRKYTLVSVRNVISSLEAICNYVGNKDAAFPTIAFNDYRQGIPTSLELLTALARMQGINVDEIGPISVDPDYSPNKPESVLDEPFREGAD